MPRRDREAGRHERGRGHAPRQPAGERARRPSASRSRTACAGRRDERSPRRAPRRRTGSASGSPRTSRMRAGSRRRSRSRNCARAEQPQRHHRVRGAALLPRKATNRAAQRVGGERLGRRPSRARRPRTVAQTTPSSPALAAATPVEVEALGAPRLSASTRGPAAATAMPIGTLTQKIQCHDSASVSSPPATGPSATPKPEIADQMPSAAPRRSAGKAAVIIVSVSGMITAPPMPSTARAAISVPAFGAARRRPRPA